MKNRHRQGTGSRSGSATSAPHTSQTSPSTGRSQVSHQLATTRLARARESATLRARSARAGSARRSAGTSTAASRDEEREGRRLGRALDGVADLARRGGLLDLQVADRAVERPGGHALHVVGRRVRQGRQDAGARPCPRGAVVLMTGASPRNASVRRRSPAPRRAPRRRRAPTCSAPRWPGSPPRRSARPGAGPARSRRRVASITRIAMSARSSASRLRRTA